MRKTQVRIWNGIIFCMTSTLSPLFNSVYQHLWKKMLPVINDTEIHFKSWHKNSKCLLSSSSKVSGVFVYPDVGFGVFSRARLKKLLLSTLSSIYPVCLHCAHFNTTVCECVCNFPAASPHPPHLIAFLKSCWFAQSPRLEAHTQQMFHWKGHECLIICVIDAAFLFVSKCEWLLGSYIPIFACSSGHVCEFTNSSLFHFFL